MKMNELTKILKEDWGEFALEFEIINEDELKTFLYTGEQADPYKGPSITRTKFNCW